MSGTSSSVSGSAVNADVVYEVRFCHNSNFNPAKIMILFSILSLDGESEAEASVVRAVGGDGAFVEEHGVADDAQAESGAA